VLNANWYEVGEIRKRLIIVGRRRGAGLGLFQYPPRARGDPLVLADVIGSADPASDVRSLSTSSQHAMSFVPEGENHNAMPPGVERRYMANSYGKRGNNSMGRVAAMDDPCPTITGNANSKRACLRHPYQSRNLSTSERAVIQSFPPRFRFMGGLISRDQQIGDAVPCKMC
jgi:DNA (cytosine-5)-methyltransferase 1